MRELRKHTIHQGHQESTGESSISITVGALLYGSGLIVGEVVAELSSYISMGMRRFIVIETIIIEMTFRV